MAQTDADAAAPLLQAAVEAGTASGDLGSVAFATQYAGLCRLFGGDLAGAAQAMERAFEMHTGNGSPVAAFALTDQAVAVMLAGDTARAAALYEQALALVDQGGDPWTRSRCLWGAGLSMWLQGDLDRAERAERQALRVIGELDERSGIALCLDALAWIAATRRDPERAAVLQGAASSVWESIPGRLPAPLRGHEERCRCLIRQGLGPDACDRQVEKGRRLERTAAVAYGLKAPGLDAADAVGTGWPAVLTKREREVAELVAAGLTDRDIASRLVISLRTAESHVQHILAKLGFRSRSQIAAWVATVAMSRAASPQ